MTDDNSARLKAETAMLLQRIAELEQISAADRSALAEFQQREAQLRTIAEYLPAGVWLIDAAGTIVYANAAAREQWPRVAYAGSRDVPNYATSSETGKPFLPENWAGVQALASGRGLLHSQVTLRQSDGAQRVISISAVSVRGDGGSPVGAVVLNQDVTETELPNQELREQATALDLAYDAIFLLDMNGTIQFWNHGAEQRYGWTKHEALGRISHQLLKTEFPEPLECVKRTLLATGRWEGDLVHYKRDGSRIDVATRWAMRRGPDGNPNGYLEIASDISEKKRVEEQLRQTQKLESVGLLAGGVAHDFNNLLIGVIGNASLALESVPASSPIRSYMEGVLRAGERAADLTRQLLAYAGKGRFETAVVDISGLVREIASLVRSSVPRTVQLRLDLQEHLPCVQVDATQLQQVVMNLVINGAEAIEADTEGTVLVTTGVQIVDEHYIRTTFEPGEITPGKYVFIEVHDTGRGMDDNTKRRIFDPFFTTKARGRGLGLSATLGIVRSHKGAVKVYSTAGKGTTFKVLLPAVEAAVPAVRPSPEHEDLSGSGLILVVDDEEIVRRTVKAELQRYGYKVLLAEDGQSAIDVFREMPERISVVLLDLMMPTVGGSAALRELQAIRPDVRVILSSGYNEVETVRQFAGKGLIGFIQKPYTAVQLARKVKAALTAK